MTDLIQRLHHYANGECNMTPVGLTLLEAADRIEHLAESNKELTLQLLATSGQAADALDRAVVAEAKLAKAVGCLRFYAALYKAPFGTRARAMLAKLEKIE